MGQPTSLLVARLAEGHLSHYILSNLPHDYTAARVSFFLRAAFIST